MPAASISAALVPHHERSDQSTLDDAAAYSGDTVNAEAGADQVSTLAYYVKPTYSSTRLSGCTIAGDPRLQIRPSTVLIRPHRNPRHLSVIRVR